VDAMVLFSDLNQDNIASKLITFAVYEVNVFQGVKIAVTVDQKLECTIHD